MKSSNVAARMLACCLLTALMLGSLAPEQAVAQRFKILPFGQQKTEKQETLALSEKAGPWLIMCASFAGVDGQQQAIRLAQELRERHGLKAYVYHQKFDFSQQVANKGLGYQKPVAAGTQNVQKREMELANGSSKVEFAVLVGDFPTIDDARAQKLLANLKQLKPESMNHFSEDIEDSALSGARLRAMSDALYGKQGQTWTSMSNAAAANSEFPLRTAFLLTNPMLPDEYFAANRVDRYVLGLNEGLEYSLLKNPKAYTIRVASFVGQTRVNLEEINRLKSDSTWRRRNDSGRNNSSLVECAKKASILTKYLRNKGIPAFEFHDRYESYVCVGGYDWVTREQNGAYVTNPEVQRVMNLFQGKQAGHGRVLTGFALPGKLISAGITCDANPIPVTVPREDARQAEKSGLFR